MISEEKEASNVVDALREKEIPIENNRLKKMFLYETGADTVCEFGNGESIRVNKSFLACYSPVFKDLFFGESPVTTVTVEDFDCETFRTFLDCLFGLKKYTVLDALLIYPIAHKYDVEKCLKKCAKILIPDKMDENVCLTLNLATFYNDKKLEDKVISFLKMDVGFFNLLKSDCYRNLLEPLAISCIIAEIKMDSFLWKIIYQWGNEYLKKHNKLEYTVRLLFEKNDILSKLLLKDFESASSILDFHDLSNKELLNSDEILNFFKDNSFQNKNIPDKGLWVDVKKGDKIIENVIFISPVPISRDKEQNRFSLSVSTNRIYFENSLNLNCHAAYLYKFVDTKCIPRSPTKTKCDKMREEEILDRNEKEFYGYCAIDENLNAFDVFGAEITYEFSSDCTILKTFLSEKFVNRDKLCFTKDFECELKMVNIW